MKKTILFVFAVVAIAATSCKKDRVCECTYTDTAPGSVSSTSNVTLLEVSKGTAKRACVTTTSTYTVSGTSYTQKSDCKLK